MKIKKVLLWTAVAVVICILLVLAFGYSPKFPLSPLNAVSGLDKGDIAAIVLVTYETYGVEDFVKNLKPEFIVGDKKACRKACWKYFSVDVPVIEEITIEEIVQGLPTPTEPGGEYGIIVSANGEGLVFVTKDGQLIVLELFLSKEETYIAKYPCNALGKILDEIQMRVFNQK